MATTKLRILKEDPSKKAAPSQQEIDKANQFARTFALRKGLISGENTHVGNAIPQFVDAATGLPTTASTPKYPSNMVMDVRQVPSYVTPNDIITGKDGFHYYENQETGDMIPLHPDILRTPRFNPNRGKSLEMLIAKK